MKITAIQLKNLRGFKEVSKTDFSESINIFIGPNNAGKSTVLNAIFMLQRNVLGKNDITIGERIGKVILYYSEGHFQYIKNNTNLNNSIVVDLLQGNKIYSPNGDIVGHPPQKEPDNLIYPYLSKRKSIGYNETINEANTVSVEGNFNFLYSKIDRIVTPQFQPANKLYIEACESILGFVVSTLAKGAGKKAVYFIKNSEHIPLTAMGEGVANILGLVTDLCVAENKIFLIEEPENDIHPKALKSLLKLIVEKSDTNQFFISTHSNIVMKYLGGELGSKVFKVTNDARDKVRSNLFISNLSEVPNIPEIRRQVLEDLGYDFFDFDLWKGWLFLEESSAEILIRDYFIDWFVSPLKNKLRTFSAGGTASILPKFEDFDRLFIFLHMEPTYKNKVWVIIDSGDEEANIINKMKEKYTKSGWLETNFSQFKEHDFEKYLPYEFQSKVDEILVIKDKQERRKAKKELIEEVKKWIAINEEAAKEKFKESAKEVIEKLKIINNEISK